MASSKLPRPPFPLRDGERLVAQRHGASLHRLGATGGRLWLTTERVVFWPQVPLAFWIIPVLGLALFLMNRPQRRDLALAQLAPPTRTTFGRNPNVLVLGRPDLSRDLKVVLDDFDGFAAALSQLVAPPSPSVIDPDAPSPTGSPDAPSSAGPDAPSPTGSPDAPSSAGPDAPSSSGPGASSPAGSPSK